MHQSTITRGWRAHRHALTKIARLALAFALLLPGFAPTALAAQSPTTFTVRIENISGDAALPSPFAPGVWTVNDPSVTPFFEVDTPDRGLGLAALAEDGAVADLAAAVAGQTGIHSRGVFNRPVGAAGPGPLLPGSVYEFEVTANPGDHLAFASMLVQTNDIFIGPGANGLALFDSNGQPRRGDITSETPFWDAGSELNEAPGMGPNQAPRQRAANTGPAEGVVSAFGNSTRTLPLPGHIIEAAISENNGEFTFTIHNISGASGAIDTPVAPVFYATHNDQWSLFTPGQTASAGLEELAEDGSPAGLVGEHTGATGTGMVGAQPITDQRPADPPGPAFTGESYTFSVTPTADFPYLTLAAMVVQTNDVFLAFGPHGLRLLDENDNPRSTAAILHDFNHAMAIWDAGAEANEVPGVGPNQAPRQAGPNTGPADPNNAVRLYSDPTNDLDSDLTNDRDGDGAGGFGAIVVTNGANSGEFDVTLTNTSDQTVYPGLLTPVAYVVHSGDVQLFTPDQPASEGLERLAEDGNFQPLVDALTGAAGVLSAGAQPIADGATDPGPIMPGGSYSFSFTADSDHPYLSVASMIVPSNDTFFAFEPEGLRVLNEDGAPRINEELAADIAAMRLAWDAGTERNQAGAAGPDQAPRQAGPNTGANEGSGNVTLLNDPIWAYPQPADVVRITLEPHTTGGDAGILYVSSSSWGAVDGIQFADEDILAYDIDNDTWTKLFDGSDVGIVGNDVDAFTVLDDGSLLLSFSRGIHVPGIEQRVQGSDIVKCIPQTLGEETSGTFELYFDGSDVGLTGWRNNLEDVDSIALDAQGRLVLSTKGTFFVPGIRGRDEDLIVFNADSLGEETSGAWERYLDGSDVGLQRNSEDVWGAWIADDGAIYLTTKGDFSVEGVSGSAADIFICQPTALGEASACAFSLFWRGADGRFGNENIDGLAHTAALPAQYVDSPAVSAAEASEGMSEDANIDTYDNCDIELDAAGHTADDAADGSGEIETFFIPFAAR
ncbi:MAG: spondin domain-containing protein [Caldilineaceae bacterium]